MNMLSEAPASSRQRLLDTLLGVSCALEEVSKLSGIDHVEQDLRALRDSADALIQRLAD